jgi:hypothetical protein
MSISNIAYKLKNIAYKSENIGYESTVSYKRPAGGKNPSVLDFEKTLRSSPKVLDFPDALTIMITEEDVVRFSGWAF